MAVNPIDSLIDGAGTAAAAARPPPPPPRGRAFRGPADPGSPSSTSSIRSTNHPALFRGGFGLVGEFRGAGSGGRCNALVVGEEFSELFAGGVVAEAFAGPVVEFVGDGLELGGGVRAEVGALGEVFAEQAVDVLVAAALPG